MRSRTPHENSIYYKINKNVKDTLPVPTILLDYEMVFAQAPVENRVSLLDGISKNDILVEIAALNYRLKPYDKIRFDTSLDTQVKELQYFTKTEEIYIKYSTIAERFSKSKDHFPIIFNRPACLFAMEEILNSNEVPFITGYKLNKVEHWESILKYLLAVNSALGEIKKEEEPSNSTFESLNPKLLPLNELTIETDQIFTPFRGYMLLEYFLSSTKFQNEVHAYFDEVYGLEFDRFIFELLGILFGNSADNPEHKFFYSVSPDKRKFFNSLSIRTFSKDIYKLINIRKSPFIKFDESRFILSDNSFLIDKSYSQFINDFWFDWIKNIKDENDVLRYNIAEYRSVFGYFFEDYVTKIFNRFFENYKYSKLLMFDQLKINKKSGILEIADIYFRYGNKILIAQVKSGSIYDNEKFGGGMEELYKNDRNKFFEDFGVNQVINSIKRMNDDIELLDPKFPKGRSYHVYPCIVLNDKSFQTALMPNTFNDRFQELISEFKINKVDVRPLTLLHISDLERLEDALNVNPKRIWELLSYHHRNKRYIPPFYNTINRKDINRSYPKRVLQLYENLIRKYNPDDIEN